MAKTRPISGLLRGTFKLVRARPVPSSINNREGRKGRVIDRTNELSAVPSMETFTRIIEGRTSRSDAIPVTVP